MTPPVAQMEWMLFGGFLIVPLLFIAVAVLIAIWVYRDAEERGMDGILWLIVYLVVREDHPKEGGGGDRPRRPGRTQPTGEQGPFCPDCGAEVEADDRYCGKCGAELPRAG